MAEDKEGHEHKGKGPGGGQFVKTGGGETGESVKSPEAAPAAKKKFGKSKAAVQVASGESSEKVGKAMKALFGKKAPPLEHMASLVGAPDDATVSLGTSKDGKSLTLNIDHPQFAAERTIFKNAAGVHVKNNDFRVKGAKGTGIGSDVFGRQVEQCQESGISSIRCHAARFAADGSDFFNGYYTWPRLGYDQDIDDLMAEAPRIARALQAAFPDANTIQDVMAAPAAKFSLPSEEGMTRSKLNAKLASMNKPSLPPSEPVTGANWWLTHGTDLETMQFSLSTGSRSLAVHEDYLSKQAKRSK